MNPDFWTWGTYSSMTWWANFTLSQRRSRAWTRSVRSMSQVISRIEREEAGDRGAQRQMRIPVYCAVCVRRFAPLDAWRCRMWSRRRRICVSLARPVSRAVPLEPDIGRMSILGAAKRLSTEHGDRKEPEIFLYIYFSINAR